MSERETHSNGGWPVNCRLHIASIARVSKQLFRSVQMCKVNSLDQRPRPNVTGTSQRSWPPSPVQGAPVSCRSPRIGPALTVAKLSPRCLAGAVAKHLTLSCSEAAQRHWHNLRLQCTLYVH